MDIASELLCDRLKDHDRCRTGELLDINIDVDGDAHGATSTARQRLCSSDNVTWDDVFAATMVVMYGQSMPVEAVAVQQHHGHHGQQTEHVEHVDDDDRLYTHAHPKTGNTNSVSSGPPPPSRAWFCRAIHRAQRTFLKQLVRPPLLLHRTAAQEQQITWQHQQPSHRRQSVGGPEAGKTD